MEIPQVFVQATRKSFGGLSPRERDINKFVKVAVNYSEEFFITQSERSRPILTSFLASSPLTSYLFLFYYGKQD